MFEIYEGKKVLVTGHAGYKGSWCCHWLHHLGAEVIGYGHPPNTEPNHFTLLAKEFRLSMQDLLDKDDLQETFRIYQPDLVIHLAAKVIVARTFTEPRET